MKQVTPLAGDALGHGRRERAAVHTILAVVLHVAAGERAAVDVHGVALPVSAILEQGFVAHHHTDALGKFKVEGCGKDRRASPHGTAGKLQRRFARADLRNTHCRNGFHTAAIVDEAWPFLPK